MESDVRILVHFKCFADLNEAVKLKEKCLPNTHLTNKVNLHATDFHRMSQPCVNQWSGLFLCSCPLSLHISSFVDEDLSSAHRSQRARAGCFLKRQWPHSDFGHEASQERYFNSGSQSLHSIYERDVGGMETCNAYI